MSLLIRPAEPGDYRAIHRLCTHPEVAPALGTSQFDPPDFWRQRLADPDSDHVHHLTAWSGSKLAGSVRLEVSPRPRVHHLGELSLAVEPSLQRRGIGSRLLGAMVDAADRWLNVIRLELGLRVDNLHARRLYERYGFQVEVRRRMDMLQDGVPVDGLTMGRLRPGFTPAPVSDPPAWPAPRRNRGPLAIRPVRPDDAEALALLHRDESVMWGTMQLPTISVESWRRRLVANEGGSNLLFLLEVGGRVAGAGGIHGFANPRLRHVVHLGMSIANEFQGMGLGGELLGALLTAATGESKGRRGPRLARDSFAASRIELEVYPDNVRAARLYERAGFLDEGVRRAAVFRDGSYVDTRVMAMIR